MRVFRIEREKFLTQTLSGKGAAKSDGFRWNSLDTYLVYTAESRALALLEISVHLDLTQDLPTDRYFVEIDIPDSIEILELLEEQLPENWDSKPPTILTQNIGDIFVFLGNAAVLKVPSSIVPPEFNYLINPIHPQAAMIKVITVNKFGIDSRFKQKKK